MMLKEILEEARVKAEKIKDEVVNELLKSKTLNQLVGNDNFIKALSYAIGTKDEVKKVVGNQVKHIFKVMNVPNKKEMHELGKKLEGIEKAIEKFATQKIAVRTLVKKKSSPKKKFTQGKKSKKKVRG